MTQPSEPEIDSHLIDALLATVRARHGAHLPPEAEARLRERVQQLRTLTATLDRIPLTNADPPDLAFAPDLTPPA